MTMVQVYYDDRGLFLSHTASRAKYKFSNLYDIPESHVVLYKHERRQKYISNDILLSGRYSLAARPLVGDHIHMAISFWVHGYPHKLAEHDRDPIQVQHYEPPYFKNETVCHAPGNISYHKVWPHAGVHTHCDGLIHVHPWSAPRTLRKEGLDVQLGLWFDQVGIEYRELPNTSLTFSDGKSYTSNETHKWHIAEKTCFLHKQVDRIYTEQLDTIWLGHAYASYVVWYGLSTEMPESIEAYIDNLKRVGVHGLKGQKYPQNCVI
tara:strand:+ start:9186 stop:9977 length:792 start_codon:yes stop_codon:yes gene_type:complete